MIVAGAFIWFALTTTLFCFVVGRTARLSPVNLVRVSLRAIFGAMAFTPTLVGGYMAAVPAPASLVVALGLFYPDWLGTMTAEQTRLAALLLGIVTVVWFFAICGGPKVPATQASGKEQERSNN